MENLKVKELIEICEELGITLGRAKRKQAILEIMKDEGVSAEEVDEAWVDIKARREEAERREVEAREREEAERREAREREERREAREREEAERQERLEERPQSIFESPNSDKTANEGTIPRTEVTADVCDEVAADYWDGLGVDEHLPNLCFSNASNETSSQCMNISGRRVVSVVHFIKAIQELGNHRCASPHGGFFELQTERRVGFWSEYTFKCNGCAENRKVTTDPVAEPTPLTEKTALGVNDAAVWGFMSIGSGHSHLEEAMSVMEIPAMSKGSFLRREESIGMQGEYLRRPIQISTQKTVKSGVRRIVSHRYSTCAALWKVALLKEMTEAGEQEKRLAEAAGHFCEDGSTPWITVVVDGGWSHRSHGHRYSANSGLAVIVGKRTQKLLYLGVRNKLCST
ncbi:hypothetical protein HPB51_011192 [Rhipicephalus microplus]|uniref:Mutator-like transposase domain-containing protein n=1 Tax=Rhipicephalus microplus TaxID=6941 RepID=A0A9J6F320_RHIMP|nr:hypothetical protein HPB51_011192 [Rhipicephalus microplus]